MADSPTRRFPIHPAHPERLCWGCERWCRAGDMACGNGAERSPHPVELLGPDWQTEVLNPALSDNVAEPVQQK